MMADKLSIIIPTLNEADTLGDLLADLSTQRGVEFSVVIADGGSVDTTREVFERLTPSLPFAAQLLVAPKGRGSQLNAGARAATGDLLLFLHADTKIADSSLLARAAACIHGVRERYGHERVAAHFGLSFGAGATDNFYYFYEAKTFTNRPHTVNGDQGLLVTREFFWFLGGFDETLPFMEDARIERRIRESGELVLLPGAVTTSARRFEAEGRRERQTLNALVRVFEAAGGAEFLAQAKDLYREQASAGKLDLLPFFRAARRVNRGAGFWRGAGAYVRENAWQLPFALDCRRARRKGVPPKDCEQRFTRMLMRPFDALTDNPIGVWLSALLTAGAFYAFMVYLSATGPDTKND